MGTLGHLAVPWGGTVKVAAGAVRLRIRGRLPFLWYTVQEVVRARLRSRPLADARREVSGLSAAETHSVRVQWILKELVVKCLHRKAR